MRPAAVLDTDNASVSGRKLVGAHAERGLQGARDRNAERTGTAVGRGAARHRAAWADVSGPPPLGRLDSTFAGQHPFAPETELEDNLGSLFRVSRIVGRKECSDHARVVGVSRQKIPRVEVPWP